MLKATVSGSFHRHMPAIYTAVGELRSAGVNVLSPSDPRVVDHLGEFLFVASDKLRSIKLVQDRHFEAIRCSDFLWVVCPDGYTGASTSAEIGAAYATRTPVFSAHSPLDITLRQYVRVVPSVRAAVDLIGVNVAADRPQHFLLEPDFTIENTIKSLERLKPILQGRARSTRPGDAEREVQIARRQFATSFGFGETSEI